CMQYIQIPLTF
nr:immunoglobulin light chain junction region [Macaca mulatta]MOX84555.1 immunoglobulin light chain junction region [Macaca mulatta]MOX88489.1 immunoglobulin light chain junction region [Macaca mulatta]MOX88522.1 immunoglobulin light chain junction region [Macaca mulatta]MOX90131.1 immunoglobulin light chain junction region [Macaca mulatta]